MKKEMTIESFQAKIRETTKTNGKQKASRYVTQSVHQTGATLCYLLVVYSTNTWNIFMKFSQKLVYSMGRTIILIYDKYIPYFTYISP